MAKPELEVTHRFANGAPLAWRCSVCHENIAENQPLNDANTVEAAFDLHKKQRHSEDFSQAAARIVREATKGH
jgi:hypothetical protein